MFVLLVVMNTYSVFTGLICQICLIFLFFEAVFGICLGCKFYPMFHKEKTQYCPGDVCEVKVKQEIQKTSLLQKGVVIGYLVFVITDSDPVFRQVQCNPDRPVGDREICAFTVRFILYKKECLIHGYKNELKWI